MIKRLIIQVLSKSGYLRDNYLNDLEHERYWKWLYEGKPIPPPDLVKQITVKEYANRYNTNIMVETGTYKGDMVFAVKNMFDRIYTIELNDVLYSNAVERFSKYRKVSVIKGDSERELSKIIEDINEPCLFWLDAHYMESVGTKGQKETPIVKEVEYISKHSIKNHVLLIDDARYFTSENDYPSVEELRDIVRTRLPNHSFYVKNDIIRITPNVLFY